jgi:hypothetical protein
MNFLTPAGKPGAQEIGTKRKGAAMLSRIAAPLARLNDAMTDKNRINLPALLPSQQRLAAMARRRYHAFAYRENVYTQEPAWVR